jgi:hypothetical protein
MSEAMSNTDTLATPPAGETTPETKVETPVNDGIIDLDAQSEVETDEGEGKTEQTEADKAKVEAEAKATEEKKKPSGAARAKIREQRLLNENAELQRKLEETSRQTPVQVASDDVKPPKEEDFNGDWFAFQRALTAYEAGKKTTEAIEKVFKSREETERSAKQAEVARERATAHAERVEEARGTITDFDEAMAEMKGVNVRNDVLDEIMSSDKSALLAYHLAKNPDKLDALNSMSGRELAREMGRLEATVKMPEAKKQTSAPAPLDRPRGGAAPPSQEADLAAYLKKTYGDRAR